MNIPENYSLRKLEPDDLELVLSWRNHPEIRRYMFTQHEISDEEHAQWYKRESQNEMRKLMILECDCVPVGFIQFQINEANNEADWGFYVSPDAPKGTGRKLGQVALSYAFINLRLGKVMGQAIDFNERSIKLHLSLGFTPEETRENPRPTSDSHSVVLFYGIDRENWESATSN